MIHAAMRTSLLVTAIMLLGFATAGAEAPAPRPPAVHAIAAGIPTLSGAVALGTLVAIDPVAHVGEFRIGCGWHIRPKHKTRIGLWKVVLHGLSFEFETYPGGPTSGINHTESLQSWERSVKRTGWSGTLYLSRPHGFVTDGPTTDICAGVLG